MAQYHMRHKKNTEQPADKEWHDHVLEVNRVSRTVKGGRRIRFRALVIVGNKQGKIGFGVGKGTEVAVAVNKAKDFARKHLITVPIVNGTIPHAIAMQCGNTNIILKPTPAGTSLIAGATVRAIMELVGIQNISSKVIGSTNPINCTRTIFYALENLRSPQKEKND